MTSRLRRLIDVVMRRPSPPHDERSVKADELAQLTENVRDVASHVDRIVPSGSPLRGQLERRLASYSRVRVGR